MGNCHSSTDGVRYLLLGLLLLLRILKLLAKISDRDLIFGSKYSRISRVGPIVNEVANFSLKRQTDRAGIEPATTYSIMLFFYAPQSIKEWPDHSKKEQCPFNGSLSNYHVDTKIFSRTETKLNKNCSDRTRHDWYLYLLSKSMVRYQIKV
jgi:hypothetical protein